WCRQCAPCCAAPSFPACCCCCWACGCSACSFTEQPIGQPHTLRVNCAVFYPDETISLMPKTFHEIPRQRPATPLLDRAATPVELRRLSEAELEQLADELRQELLYSVGQTGGHFGAGLGVIELTIALHYIFDTPDDRLVWDVGHQAYPHKILTGRRQRMG